VVISTGRPGMEEKETDMVLLAVAQKKQPDLAKVPVDQEPEAVAIMVAPEVDIPRKVVPVEQTM